MVKKELIVKNAPHFIIIFCRNNCKLLPENSIVAFAGRLWYDHFSKNDRNTGGIS